MTHAGKMLVCTLGMLVLCTDANAVSPASSTPYQGIVERNVFGLKDPPPPPDPEANKPPPPKIILTGITTIFGNKRALMKATPPAKPPEPAKEQTYMLAEGQRDGDIEVLEIDEKAGTVKVNDFGTIMTLNFSDNGVKLTSTLPPGAASPGMPATPGGIPSPLPSPANPFSPGGGFNKAIPTRTLRLPTPQAGGESSAVNGSMPALPAVPVTQQGSSGTAAAKTWPPETPMTLEEQHIIMAVQQEQNKSNPNFPPFPVNPLTGVPNTAQPSAPVPNPGTGARQFPQ
jgi:hypothetical protein